MFAPARLDCCLGFARAPGGIGVSQQILTALLMGNLYDLMVETPEGNLVAGMRWLQNTYTRRHNCRHRLWGRLFGDRYKAILSEGGSGYYYCSLMDYWRRTFCNIFCRQPIVRLM
jgi:hypothetical protein